MKKILLTILISLGTLPAISNQYNVYSPNNFNDAIKQENQKERILFILDLSNSMEEPLENSTKFNLFFHKSIQKIEAHICLDKNLIFCSKSIPITKITY